MFPTYQFDSFEILNIIIFGLSINAIFSQCPVVLITLTVTVYVIYKILRFKKEELIDICGKAVFITGCDTGALTYYIY